MGTNYIKVLMRKNSTNKGSAYAHNLFYGSSHVLDFY